MVEIAVESEDAEPAYVVQLDDLPPHLLALVLDCLPDVTDLARASAVCNCWRDIVKTGVWPGARRFQLRRWARNTAEAIAWYSERCRNLEEVEAAGCASLTEADLAPLGSAPLRCLNLSRCWKFEGYDLLAAINARGRLESVDLSDTAVHIDMLAEALAPSFAAPHCSDGPGGCSSGVTTLRLSRIGIENEYGIRDLPWIGPALRHLDLSHNAWLATHHAYGLLGANDGSGAAVNPGDAAHGVANPGHHPHPTLGPMLLTHTVSPPRGGSRGSGGGGTCTRVTALQSLNLSDCPRLQSLPCVEALTSLLSLDVCRTAISGGCLLSIAKRCRHLRALAVSGCVNLTGAGLETAAYHLRLHSLRADDLAGAGDGVAAVVANMPLSAAGTDDSGRSGRLFEVSAACGGLTDATLTEVAQYLRLLASYSQEVSTPVTAKTASSIVAATTQSNSHSSQQLPRAPDQEPNQEASYAVEQTADALAGQHRLDVCTTSAGVAPPKSVAQAPARCVGAEAATAGADAAAARSAVTVPASHGAAVSTARPVSGETHANGPPAGFAVLRVAGCARLGRPGLQALARVGAFAALRELDVSHLDGLWAKPAGVLCEVAASAGSRLRMLAADGCSVSDAVLGAVGAHCPELRHLSLVGCRGVTDAGLAAVAAGCPRLGDLAVGGGSALLWAEERALPAFTAITSLRLARRNQLQDLRLVAALEQLPQLNALVLAGCADITDRCLAALPVGLTALHLSTCERLQGEGLSRLAHLRSLRLSGCPAVTEAAVQAAAMSCSQLQVLELPSGMDLACVPSQNPSCAGHLRGLKLEGGRRNNTHWLRRRSAAVAASAAAAH